MASSSDDDGLSGCWDQEDPRRTAAPMESTCQDGRLDWLLKARWPTKNPSGVGLVPRRCVSQSRAVKIPGSNGVSLPRLSGLKSHEEPQRRWPQAMNTLASVGVLIKKAHGESQHRWSQPAKMVVSSGS